MPFSQIIPPSLSHRVQKTVLYICLFCCLSYRVIVTIFLIPYICVSVLYWCFSFWLTSLCIIGSSFIHLIRTDSNVFFLMAEEIQPVHSEGDQPWDFFGRNNAKAETPVLWPPHAKSWLIGKDSDAGRDWGQEEKGMTEDEMAGWHHWLDGREFEWALGIGDGQGGLACCNLWGCKESDTTERLNWTELNSASIFLLPSLTIPSILYCSMQTKFGNLKWNREHGTLLLSHPLNFQFLFFLPLSPSFLYFEPTLLYRLNFNPMSL